MSEEITTLKNVSSFKGRIGITKIPEIRILIPANDAPTPNMLAIYTDIVNGDYVEKSVTYGILQACVGCDNEGNPVWQNVPIVNQKVG